MFLNCYLTHISLLFIFPSTFYCINQTTPSNYSNRYSKSDATINVKNASVVFTSSTTVRQPVRPTADVKVINTDSEGPKTLDAIKKMNLIKGSKVKTTSAPESNIATYRLNSAEEGTTCILMTVDALISFLYTSKLNEPEESDTFVPEKVGISGDCANEESSVLLLTWKSFKLLFKFSKTLGGDRWYVNGIQLSFSTQESIFKHINHPNTVVQSQTAEDDLLFVTPVGRSFKCHREIEVNLLTDFPDLKVKLLLRELTVEPFIFKNNDFGQEYLCPVSGAGSFRSETAPFVFGSLLAVASLCTVAGYSVYRYFKVNKVQYDTME